MDARIEKIARDLMGYAPGSYAEIDFMPLEDCNDTRAMEDKLYEKGLDREYLNELIEFYAGMPVSEISAGSKVMLLGEAFFADNAQRVAACLRVLEEQNG